MTVGIVKARLVMLQCVNVNSSLTRLPCPLVMIFEDGIGVYFDCVEFKR